MMRKTTIIFLLLISASFVSADWIRPQDNVYIYLLDSLSFERPYLDISSGNVTFNETKLNQTVDDRAGPGITDTNESVRFDNLVSYNCTGQVVAGVYSNGSIFCESDDTGGGGGDRWTINNPYLYNNSGNLDFNESKMNDTINALENDTVTTWTYSDHLDQVLNTTSTVTFNNISITNFPMMIGNDNVSHIFYFYRLGSPQGESFQWDENNNRFAFSDDIYTAASIEASSITGNPTAGLGDTVVSGTLRSSAALFTTGSAGDWWLGDSDRANALVYADAGTGYVTALGFNATSTIQSPDWSNVTITESQITDLTHTTDTNESGRVAVLNTTKLDASDQRYNDSITDTNESTRVDIIAQTHCAGQVLVGFLTNGSGVCEADDTGAGGSGDLNYTTDSGSEVIQDNEIMTLTGGTGMTTSGSGNTVTFTLLYSFLSNFTDDLGARGYTHLSNFTNDGVFITDGNTGWDNTYGYVAGAYNTEGNLTSLLDDNYLAITDQRYNETSQLTSVNSSLQSQITQQQSDNSTQDSLFYSSSEAATFLTVDTGQGANELYDMDQNVLTSSDTQFNTVNATQHYVSTTGCIRANTTHIIIDGDGSGC